MFPSAMISTWIQIDGRKHIMFQKFFEWNFNLNMLSAVFGMQSWGQATWNIVKPFIFIFWLFCVMLTCLPFVTSCSQVVRGQDAMVVTNVSCYWFGNIQSCKQLPQRPPKYLENGNRNPEYK